MNNPIISEKTKSLLASWSKVFLAAVITAVLASGTAPWEWSGSEVLNFVWSGVSATLVVIYNYISPKDTRYGVNSEK